LCGSDLEVLTLASQRLPLVVAVNVGVFHHDGQWAVEGESRTPAQRRYDALVDICQWFLLHTNDDPASRNRPVLELAVPFDDVKSH
jgi:hypothetical protein